MSDNFKLKVGMQFEHKDGAINDFEVCVVNVYCLSRIKSARVVFVNDKTASAVLEVQWEFDGLIKPPELGICGISGGQINASNNLLQSYFSVKKPKLITRNLFLCLYNFYSSFAQVFSEENYLDSDMKNNPDVSAFIKITQQKTATGWDTIAVSLEDVGEESKKQDK